MSLLSSVGLIINAVEIIESTEKLKGYWDDKGLDMHMAVKDSKQIVVSTKHWVRVHYIISNKDTDELWKLIRTVATQVGRSLIRSNQGPYVYIHKLNAGQTQDIFNKLRRVIGGRVRRKYQLSWNIDDAIVPEL